MFERIDLDAVKAHTRFTEMGKPYQVRAHKRKGEVDTLGHRYRRAKEHLQRLQNQLGYYRRGGKEHARIAAELDKADALELRLYKQVCKAKKSGRA